MGALRFWMLMTTLGSGWIRCIARTGRTWTRSTPSGIRPGRGNCGGAPDSVHRRRDFFDQFQFLDKFMVGPLLCNDSSVARGVQYTDNVDVLV